MIYVASPYSHPDRNVRHTRYVQAQQYTAYLINSGEVAFSPIAHSHPIAAFFEMPTDFEFWQKQCLALLSVCDTMHVLMLDDWDISKGVKAEEESAESQGIEIWYVSAEDYRRGKWGE
jgi:hypothetical protein